MNAGAQPIRNTPHRRSRDESLAIAYLVLSQDIGPEAADRMLIAATDEETEFFADMGDRVGEVVEGLIPRVTAWLAEAPA